MARRGKRQPKGQYKDKPVKLAKEQQRQRDRATSREPYSDETPDDVEKLPIQYSRKYCLIDKEDYTKAEYIDALTTDVERHMLRGVVSPERLRDLLGLKNKRIVTTCINKVKNRWLIFGSDVNKRRIRGETLLRFDNVNQAAWDIINKHDTKASDAIAALRLISSVTKTMSEVRGLSYSPTVGVNINTVPVANGGVPAEIQGNKQTREIALKFNELLAKDDKGVIEHVA